MPVQRKENVPHCHRYDAHSKWIEVFPMTSATALTTVQHLRQLFSRFGIPDSIVSDNGSQFVAKEF